MTEQPITLKQLREEYDVTPAQLRFLKALHQSAFNYAFYSTSGKAVVLHAPTHEEVAVSTPRTLEHLWYNGYVVDQFQGQFVTTDLGQALVQAFGRLVS